MFGLNKKNHFPFQAAENVADAEDFIENYAAW